VRKIKGVIMTDVVGSEVEFELEVEDDATEEEIDKLAWKEAANWMEWYWEEAEE
jgi:hypothetical protein